MDRDRHGRSPSNSFRINVNRSGSPSRDSLTGARRPRRRGQGSNKSAFGTALELLEDTRDWLGGRVFGRGAAGVRRWTLLVAVLALLVLWRTFVGGEGYFGGGQALGDDVEVPKVDRMALDKLRLLEIHLGTDEEGKEGEGGLGPGETEYRVEEPKVKYPKAPTNDPDAPPLVAEIPNVIKADPLAPLPLSKVPADILDAEVCPDREGAPCSFLVAAWLGAFGSSLFPFPALTSIPAGEQETKAQQHLYQLGLLAVSLNRTLVLPNVQKSRLGTCYANPFSFYYSPDSLSNLGIPTISHADFVAWSDRRDPPASAQVVSMVTAKALYAQGAIEIDSASDPNLVPNKPTRNLCLRPPRTRLDFSGHSPLAIYPPEGYHKNEAGRLGFGESVVNTLRSEEVGSKSSRASASINAAYSLPNVYAFNYELRFPMMSPAVVTSFAPEAEPPLPFAHFPYASTWTDLADLVVEKLSPFIAIHWRTETLTPANLAPCASSLLRKLAQLKSKYPEMENVYLATDYPVEELEGEGAGGTPHSGTFSKVVTEQHHSAFRAFLRDFKKVRPSLISILKRSADPDRAPTAQGPSPHLLLQGAALARPPCRAPRAPRPLVIRQ